jgi:hypothetical protein
MVVQSRKKRSIDDEKCVRVCFRYLDVRMNLPVISVGLLIGHHLNLITLNPTAQTRQYGVNGGCRVCVVCCA